MRPYQIYYYTLHNLYSIRSYNLIRRFKLLLIAIAPLYPILLLSNCINNNT